MTAPTWYIVDFHDAVDKFNRVISDPELPTIDGDCVKQLVLDVFAKPQPIKQLVRLAHELVSSDRLYGRSDYLYEEPDLFCTQEQANEQEVFVRNYLREAIIDLGLAMSEVLVSVGMFKGKYSTLEIDRYQLTSRPLTDDTYLFQRHPA